MTRTRILRTVILSAVVGAAAIAAAPPARAQVSVDVTIGAFQNHLSPYGRWVWHERYGNVWIPRVTTAGWRPYMYGHWVYTDADWMWISDEPFGWATYHYGRWSLDPVMGWVWVPDSVWSPAWVAWRANDDYVGWAPLPPEFDVETGVMLEPVVDPVAFTFVRTRYLVEPVLPRFYEPPARNVLIVRATFSSTRYTIDGVRVVNHGVPIERVERVVARPVPRLAIEASTTIGPTRLVSGRVIVAQPIAPTPERFTRVQGRDVIAAPAGRLRASPASREVRPADRPMPRPIAPAPAPAAVPSSTGAVPRNEVAAPPRAAAAPADLQAIQRRQAQERVELDRRHAREREHPPANLSPRALNERQAAETKELLTRQDRERRAVDAPQPRGR